jgi:hypothetical protein
MREFLHAVVVGVDIKLEMYGECPELSQQFAAQT